MEAPVARPLTIGVQPGVDFPCGFASAPLTLCLTPTATRGAAGKESPAFALSPPQVSLPKGDGAVRGIGEKFAANPVTGTGWMSVPSALSSERGGFEPQLTLSYDSGAGNGPFGLG